MIVMLGARIISQILHESFANGADFTPDGLSVLLATFLALLESVILSLLHLLNRLQRLQI